MIAEHDRRLADELERLGYPASVVDKAKAGHWSDFKTPLATPKMDLVQMLRHDGVALMAAGAGHRELAGRVELGEFDG